MASFRPSVINASEVNGWGGTWEKSLLENENDLLGQVKYNDMLIKPVLDVDHAEFAKLVLIHEADPQ